MPPLYRPGPVTGKRPPLVLPRGFESLVELGKEGWPMRLVMPTDAGLFFPCWISHGLESVNEARFTRATEAPQ
jgi:hypothetical protein